VTHGAAKAILSDDLRMFVRDALEDMDENAAQEIVLSLGEVFAGLVGGISRILDDEMGSPSELDLPPVLPHEVAKIRLSEFTKLVGKYLARLQASSWTEAQIAVMWGDSNDNKKEVTNEMKQK
jgi:hypothetical protein